MTGRKQGDTRADEGGSCTKPPRIKISKSSEGGDAKNHPAVVVPRLPAGFTLPNPAPVENFAERERGDTKDHPHSQWFLNFSEADELLKLAAARQQVQAHIVKLRRQLSAMDGLPQFSKPTAGYDSRDKLEANRVYPCN